MTDGTIAGMEQRGFDPFRGAGVRADNSFVDEWIANRSSVSVPRERALTPGNEARAGATSVLQLCVVICQSSRGMWLRIVDNLMFGCW